MINFQDLCISYRRTDRQKFSIKLKAFLCYASQDQEVADTIYSSLIRQGVTVWNDGHETQGRKDEHQAIAQGIESVDQFIFVLSPSSLRSAYCLKELEQAQALHKRIIPIIVSPVAYIRLPDILKELQPIDLETYLKNIAEGSGEHQPIKQLNQPRNRVFSHVVGLGSKNLRKNPVSVVAGGDR